METKTVVQCSGSENRTEGEDVLKQVEYAILESSLSGGIFESSLSGEVSNGSSGGGNSGGGSSGGGSSGDDSSKLERNNGEEKECLGEKIVKEGKVLSYRSSCSNRDPNVNCRVETFGVVCSKFDHRRKKWVIEMGFGGLLFLAGLQLPRTLCYWLMTRVDPVNEMFVDGEGKFHRLCTNQVRWILGIPKGNESVPSRVDGEEGKKKVIALENNYSKVVGSKEIEGGEMIVRKGYPITPSMLERAEGEWKDEDEEEFKQLFLILALQMILCPTQCPRLPLDLLPAVSCAIEAQKYDWCELVFSRLMRSVTIFKSIFNKQGYATGCGGCTMFLAIFYLDRLNRNPLSWSECPRLKVWTNAEIRKACKEDRQSEGGDFGKLKMLVVSYGKSHPRDAQDTEVEEICIEPTMTMGECSRTSRRTGVAKCPRLK